MSFLYPEFSFLLFGVAWLYLKSIQNQKSATLLPCVSNHTRKVHYVLLSAMVLMIAALCRPVIYVQQSTHKSKGFEAAIALDLSYSMRAKDVVPNRLEAGKTAIKTLLKDDLRDRFSLYGFTTQPLILSPATTDHALVISALDAIETDNILTHGTSIENLLRYLARQTHPVHHLIILSDGGDESDIARLSALIQKEGMHIIGVGMASQGGSLLEDRYGKKLKNAHGDLVISRQNPLLQTLCEKSGGTYISFDTPLSTAQKIAEALHRQSSMSEFDLRTESYVELFWILLLLAIVLILFAFIAVPKKLLLLLGLFASQSDAGLLDWHYIQNANDAYAHKQYKSAAVYLSKISRPTLQSRFDEALIAYRAGAYHDSVSILTALQTKDPGLKQKFLFLLGNAYVKMKKYDKAKAAYQKALMLGKNPDIVYNLKLIEGKHTKEQPKPPGYKKKDQMNRTVAQKEKKRADKTEKSTPRKAQKKKLSRPLGYRAYELINKGYIDEKIPW